AEGRVVLRVAIQDTHLNANGIVHVSAKDKGTGKEQKITITSSSGLKDDEIDNMVKDAERYSEDDKKKRELVDAKNQGEALVHSTTKTLEELGDKVAEADKSVVEAALEDLKSALEGEDTEAITAKLETLAQASMKLGEAMYQAADAAGEDTGGDDGQTASDADDDVVDADFEEVKDDDEKKSA
ncbi:MAG: Hsp70 family protein, partial [Halocynthiibacter sp.]